MVEQGNLIYAMSKCEVGVTYVQAHKNHYHFLASISVVGWMLITNLVHRWLLKQQKYWKS